MTKQIGALLVLVLAMLLPLPAECQPPAHCVELLKFAGETWAEKSASDKTESLVTWFCSREFDSESEATSAAAEASIPIEDVLVASVSVEAVRAFLNGSRSFAVPQIRVARQRRGPKQGYRPSIQLLPTP